MDDLLHLVHSDGADGLRLQVGQPPVVVIDGEDQQVERPAITVENAERLLQSITDTRQRRVLRSMVTWSSFTDFAIAPASWFAPKFGTRIYSSIYIELPLYALRYPPDCSRVAVFAWPFYSLAFPMASLPIPL